MSLNKTDKWYIKSNRDNKIDKKARSNWEHGSSQNIDEVAMYNLFVYSSQVHHIYKGIVFERKCHRMRVHVSIYVI